MRHYFSLSQLNATAQFSQVFYAYTKLNHIVGFLSICFQKQRQGSFEKNEKQKAMVLVIAKMNMKAHFIKFCENACIYQSE